MTPLPDTLRTRPDLPEAAPPDRRRGGVLVIVRPWHFAGARFEAVRSRCVAREGAIVESRHDCQLWSGVADVSGYWPVRFPREEVRQMRFPRITVDPRQMGGVPCIRSLRMPVATVVGMVADGMTVDEILKEHPTLEAEDISEALRYAAEAVRERMIPLDA